MFGSLGIPGMRLGSRMLVLKEKGCSEINRKITSFEMQDRVLTKWGSSLRQIM